MVFAKLVECGHIQKMQACVEAMVFFFVECSRVRFYVWVMRFLYHEVCPVLWCLCIHFSDVLFVTIYEACFFVCCFA